MLPYEFRCIFNNAHLFRIERIIERPQGINGNVLDRMSGGLQVFLVPFIGGTDLISLFFKNQNPFGLQAVTYFFQHLLQAYIRIGFTHADGNDPLAMTSRKMTLFSAKSWLIYGSIFTAIEKR